MGNMDEPVKNDTTGSSSQILKRLDAIKKRYRDTLAARKTLAMSPMMNGSPMLTLTPMPEFTSVKKASSTRQYVPVRRVEELQASGMSPPPPLKMPFSPSVPKSYSLQKKTSTIARVGSSPMHNQASGLATSGHSVPPVTTSAGGGQQSKSSALAKQSFHFNAALLQLLKAFSRDENDHKSCSFPFELGPDCVSILKNIEESIAATQKKHLALRTELSELKSTLERRDRELQEAREQITQDDIRSIVQQELQKDRLDLVQQLTTIVQRGPNATVTPVPSVPNSQFNRSPVPAQFAAAGRRPSPTKHSVSFGTHASRHEEHPARSSPSRTDNAVRNWQSSLAMRRAVSLLQYVGWDDPLKLAGLSDQQFRGVLSQVGMAESPVITRDNIINALRAARR